MYEASAKTRVVGPGPKEEQRFGGLLFLMRSTFSKQESQEGFISVRIQPLMQSMLPLLWPKNLGWRKFRLTA